MEGSKLIIAASFALILICFFYVQGVYVITPALKERLYATEKSISTHIDTLSSAGEGRIKLDIPLDVVKAVSVSYETKGNREGYTIEEDGWHVIVSYKMGSTTFRSASLIRSYPAGAPLQKTLSSPTGICVVKERDSPYAEVQKC
jgi:hypothetical protein